MKQTKDATTLGNEHQRDIVKNVAEPATELPPRVAEPEFSDDAVLKATGRSWDEWFRLLDNWHGTEHSHAEIARHLAETYPISGWWAQGVTVSYERARGMRAVNQRPDGFTVNASRTTPVDVAALYAAFDDEATRERWLPSDVVRFRSSTEAKAWRFDNPVDDSRVEARFTSKGKGESSVAIEHSRLASAEDAAAWKSWWKERLDALKRVLAESS